MGYYQALLNVGVSEYEFQAAIWLLPGNAVWQ